MAESHLRPIERVVVRLSRDGASHSEIGRRLGKRPGTVGRILDMIELRDGPPAQSDENLRPVERVVLRLRAAGESYGEIGNRLGRSGRHVRKIEDYANMKLEG
jgi:DNA-binding CsgD family transcriptional regulator